jgi:hypothetical protein
MADFVRDGTIEITLYFYDSKGAPVDPVTVTAVVTAPNLAVTTINKDTMVKVKKGRYKFTVNNNLTGQYSYTVTSTGPKSNGSGKFISL